MQTTVFDDAGARAKYKAMLEHLASLNLPFANQRVLEVGSGVGWHTGFFEKRGCRVVCTDGRPENVAEHKSRFPHRQVEVCDLDVLRSHHGYGRFDIVHCYSVLYHLEDPARTIQDLAAICDKFMIIETDVLSEDEDRIEFRKTAPEIASQSIHGVRNVVGRPWLWRELKKHFPFVYCPITQPEHADYPIRFPAPVNGKAKKIIMIGSHVDMGGLGSVVDQLPIHYKTKNDSLFLKGAVYEVPIHLIDLVGRWGKPCDFIPEKVDLIAKGIAAGTIVPVRLKYQTGKGRFKPADGVHRILSVLQIGGSIVPSTITAFDDENDPQFIADKPEISGNDVAVIGLNKLGISLATIISRCGKFRVTGIDQNPDRVKAANSYEHGFSSITDLHEAQGACVFITDGNVMETLYSLRELKTPPAAICVVKKLSQAEFNDVCSFQNVCYSPTTYEDPMLPQVIVLGSQRDTERDIVATVFTETYAWLRDDPVNTMILYCVDILSSFIIKTNLDLWIEQGNVLANSLMPLAASGVNVSIIRDVLKVFGIGNWNENY